MTEQQLTILLMAGTILLVAGFITYIWRRESAEATYFDENPLNGFWLNPVFEGLSREYDLIGCKRGKNGMGIAVTYIDESGMELGQFTTTASSTDMLVKLRKEQYRVIYPNGKNSRDLLLKLPDTTTAATYTRVGGNPRGRVAFYDGSTFFYTNREEKMMSICPVKYWRDAAGAMVAVVFKPTSLDISVIRVIAVKKGIAPHVRAAVLAFYLV